jgi:hypothetical protein
MKSVKFLMCLMIWITFSGCATIIENEVAKRKSEYWPPLLNDPDIVLIQEKVWLNLFVAEKERPLRYYEIEQYPTNEEKRILKKLYGFELGWQEIGKSIIKTYAPAYQDIMYSGWSARNNLRLELIMGKRTFGEYAMADKMVKDKAIEALHARDNQVMAQQAAMFNRYLLNQQLINTMNQPAQIRPFTCTRAGGGTYFCQ